MSRSEDHPKRVAFVVNALTGKELTAGNRDVSRIYSLFTDPQLGMCTNDSPKPLHECKSRNDFWDFLSPILDQWHLNSQFNNSSF